MAENPLRLPENGAFTPIFGYFCVELDGLETILVHIDSKNHWSFPINTTFDPTTQPVVQAIDDAVTMFCRETGLVGQTDLLTSGLEPPALRKVLIGPSPTESDVLPEGKSGYFFKVKLNEQGHRTNTDYAWVRKEVLFATSEKCIDKTELAAINRNFDYIQYGFKVLECVDVLPFRVRESKVEFLLLKREDALRGFVGWEYPKGGLLFHETIYEGALHRLKDETGVTDYAFRGHLGYQTVDVSERRLLEYNTLRVHGLTFVFTGEETTIRPADTRITHRKPTWMPWGKARDVIWMKPYGPEFFDRWQARSNEILSGLI